jgi:hypothetical protein
MPVPDNVPEEARDGLEDVLARAVGVGAFDDEKAVVWTVFSHLLQTAEAAPCWALLGENKGWPSALLWGGEALGEEAEYAREQLLEKSPDWAPDVVLEFWPAGLVMVVARHLKPNLEVRDPKPWSRCLDSEAFSDADSARMSGRLDLARAWRLGWELAGKRRFTLVNLLGVPERVQQRAGTDLFISSLREREDRHWRQLYWRQLLACVPQPLPDWLARFVAEKRLR